MPTENMVGVTVLKCIDPSQYLIFINSKETMQVFYGSPTSNQMQPTALVPGMSNYVMPCSLPTSCLLYQIYVGYHNGQWKHVLYRCTFNTLSGSKANCELLEVGSSKVVLPLCHVRDVHQNFRTRRLFLVGLQSKSLQPNENLTMTWQPSTRWDEAATTFVEQFLKAIDNWEAAILRTDKDGFLYGHLFAINRNHRFNIRDRLAEANHAFAVETEDPEEAVESSYEEAASASGIGDGHRSPRRSLASSVSGNSDSSIPLGRIGDLISSGCSSPSSDIGHGRFTETGAQKIQKPLESENVVGKPAEKQASQIVGSVHVSDPGIREAPSRPAVGRGIRLAELMMTYKAPGAAQNSATAPEQPSSSVPLSCHSHQSVASESSPSSSQQSFVTSRMKSSEMTSPQHPSSPSLASSLRSSQKLPMEPSLRESQLSPQPSVMSRPQPSVSQQSKLKMQPSSPKPPVVEIFTEWQRSPLPSVTSRPQSTRLYSTSPDSSEVSSSMESQLKPFPSFMSRPQPSTLQQSRLQSTSPNPPEVLNSMMDSKRSPSSTFTSIPQSSSSQPSRLQSTSSDSPDVSSSLESQLKPFPSTASRQQPSSSQQSRSQPPYSVSSSDASTPPEHECETAQLLVTSRLPKTKTIQGSTEVDVPYRPALVEVPLMKGKAVAGVPPIDIRGSPPKKSSAVAAKSSPRNIVVEGTLINRSFAAKSSPSSSPLTKVIGVESPVNRSPVIGKNSPDVQLPDSGRLVHADKDFDVFVDSELKINACTNLEDFSYHDILLESRGFQDVRKPTQLQMYAWEAVFKGYDVIGVAPSKQGKTLSYLMPLVAMLENKELYRYLPRYGIGPYAVILCSSWVHVQTVYDQCCQLISRPNVLNYLRPLLMYAAGGDQDIQVKLINGSDIIISTPNILLRMLEERSTDLSRVCHLVIEDADILCDEFKFTMDSILNQYQTVLNDRIDTSVPQQLLMFSQNWTEEMWRVSRQIQDRPVVLIGSRTEAIYYGRVKQKPIQCKMEDRFQTALTVVKSGLYRKIIVCTSDDNTCEVLHERFNRCSVEHLTAHGQMYESELLSIIKEWHSTSTERDSTPILILSDTIVNQIDICDALVVIHYDIPRQQSIFASRMWCCRSNFYRQTKQDTHELTSVLLLPNDDSKLLYMLMRPLKRSGVQLPTDVLDVIDQETKQLALSRNAPLCFAMKSLGFCRASYRCKDRHFVMSSLDSPKKFQLQFELPAEGTVKVFVTAVRSAVCYYVRMVEHTSSSGTVTSWNENIKCLMLEIAVYFCNPQNRIVCKIPVEGQLYAFEDSQHVFHRVQVTDIFGDPAEEVKIFFVDHGRRRKVPIHLLYILPYKFASVVHQVVEVFLCRLKPVDNDVTWTSAADKFVAEKITGKELEGKIVLCLGGTLWLDPIVERKWLPSLKKTVEVFCVRSLLTDKSYALANPQHVESLYKMCENSDIVLPVLQNATTAYRTNGQMVTTQTVQFPSYQELYEVFVSAIENPDHFYVQLASDKLLLAELHNEINQFMAVNERVKIVDAKQGHLVIAKHPSDNKWYRGKVASVEGGSVDVFFVDYGEAVFIAIEDVQPMPSHFERMPFKAIECCLVDIECVGLEWDETFDQLAQVCEKLLHAEVCCSMTAQYTGRYRYGLRLQDMSTAEYDVSIESHLVAMGSALLSSAKLEEMFFVQESSALKEISSLCLSIVKEQDTDVCSSTLHELQNLVYNVCDSGDERHGLVRVINQTLEYCWQPDVAEVLLELLHILFIGNSSHCEEMCGTGSYKKLYWNNLCHMLDQFCSTTKCIGLKPSHRLLLKLEKFLKEALNCVTCCVCFAECGGLRILSQLLMDYGNCESTIGDLLLLVDKVTQNVTSNRDFMSHGTYIEQGCIKCLVSIMQHLSSNGTNIVNKCMQICKIFAFYNTNFESLIKSHNLFSTICSQLENWNDFKILTDGMKLLRQIIMHGCVSKDIVNRSLILEILDRLLLRENELPKDLNNAISALYERVQLTLPALAKTLKNDTQRERPVVRWSQSKHSILLIIDVKDTQETDDMLRATEESVHFRTVVLSVEYAFELLNLYLEITYFDLHVTPSCIQVGLHKRQKGLWPQLLKGKAKLPSHIVFDTEHSVMSSSEDEESDSDAPLMLLTKKARQATRPGWGVISESEQAQPREPYTLCVPSDSEKRSSGNESDSSDDEDDEFGLDMAFDPTLQQDRELGFHTGEFRF